MNVTRQTRAELSEEQLTALSSHSLFSSPDFAALWSFSGGEEICFVVEDNLRAVALMPGVEFGKGKLRRFQAMPDGCYASVVKLLPSVDMNLVSRALIDALKSEKYFRTVITDFYDLFPETDKFKAHTVETMIAPVDSAEWLPPDKKMQSEIRKAMREKVRVDRFDPEKHFDGFLSLVEMTEKRHNRSTKYPEHFFRKLAELSVVDERIVWRYVMHNQIPVLSHINLRIGEMLFHWQSYSDRQFSSLKANQLALTVAAQEAFSSGVTKLNLGSSPDNSLDLLSYKSKFGAKALKYKQYSYESILGRIL